MSRIRRPPTKLIRIRISDLNRLRAMARRSQKQLPDFMSYLIRLKRRRR